MAQSASTTDNQKSFEIPSVMRAAQQSAFGEARDVLTIRDDVPVPRELSGKQVLVRICAAASNPIDWKVMNGKFGFLARLKFPHIPGKDCAGVVVAVAPEVTRFKVGDKVYGNLGFDDGCFAEYIRANETLFSLKPAPLSMEEAAAVPLTCETSYQALFTKFSPPVGAGTKLFICGGSAATGFFAIQMAKAVGAQVATTCSKRNFALLEKFGYKLVHNKSEFTNDPQQLLVVDYTEKDFGEVLEGENYDCVFDCVGGANQWPSAQRILKRNGQFITLIGDNPEADLNFKTLASVGSTIIGRKIWSMLSPSHHQYAMHASSPKFPSLDELSKFIEAGQVKPLIDQVYDWRKNGVEDLIAMYDKSKGGKSQGKLVIKIADE